MELLMEYMKYSSSLIIWNMNQISIYLQQLDITHCKSSELTFDFLRQMFRLDPNRIPIVIYIGIQALISGIYTIFVVPFCPLFINLFIIQPNLTPHLTGSIVATLRWRNPRKQSLDLETTDVVGVAFFSFRVRFAELFPHFTKRGDFMPIT